MWRIFAILLIGCCYSSAEQLKLTIVPLPDDVPTWRDKPAVDGASGGESRIIGGTPAAIQRYPYAVQVLYNNQLACGGSLLTARHVLSAAHCFVNAQGVLQPASLFTCRVGTATLNSGGTSRAVSMIINHESYNYGFARDNDISVLLLASSVSLSSSVGVAALPPQNAMLYDNVPVWVIGWGRTIAEVNQASTNLMEAQVYTINQGVCWQRYQYLASIRPGEQFPVTVNMMCSGILDYGGRDACQGDSGGPVVYIPAPTVAPIVVGVTSWGEGCAHPTYPGVNARVSAYTNWINATVTRYNGAPSLGQTSLGLLLLSCLVSAVFSRTL